MTTQCQTDRVMCDLVEAPAAPSRILAVPWGVTQRTRGMPFILDERSTGPVLNSFRALGHDLVVDFEHQSEGGELASPDGKAPAAGWISDLAVIPGEGVYATVAWTELAQKMIAAKEYRYLSPVVRIERKGGLVVSLESVALTNRPAIIGAKPLVNSQAAAEVVNKDADAEPAVLEQLRSLVERGGTMSTADLVAGLRSILAAFEGSGEAVSNSVRSGVEGASGGGAETASDTETVRLENARLRNELQRREADELLLVNRGKVPPARERWFRDLYARDPDYAREYIAGAPVLVNTGAASVEMAGSPGRAAVIARARAEYDGEAGRVICSQKALVNLRLSDAGFAALTADEVARFGIATGDTLRRSSDR